MKIKLRNYQSKINSFEIGGKIPKALEGLFITHTKTVDNAKELMKKKKLIEDELDKAYNYLNTYLYSPGYLERLRKAQGKLFSDNKYRKKQLAIAGNGMPKYFFKPKIEYHPGNGSMKIRHSTKNNPFPTLIVTNRLDYRDIGNQSIGDVIAHELAHEWDYTMPMIGADKYSDAFWQLKYNIAREWQDAMHEAADGKNSKLSEDLYAHDAKLEEIIADILSFRYQLDRLGLYNSYKANNPFTKEHLNKYLKYCKDRGWTPHRAVKNLRDNVLIWIMNNLAQNNNNNDNNYA